MERLEGRSDPEERRPTPEEAAAPTAALRGSGPPRAVPPGSVARLLMLQQTLGNAAFGRHIHTDRGASRARSLRGSPLARGVSPQDVEGGEASIGGDLADSMSLGAPEALPGTPSEPEGDPREAIADEPGRTPKPVNNGVEAAPGWVAREAVTRDTTEAPGELDTSIVEDVMETELAEATAEPGVHAEQSPGQPAVLVPDEEPPPPGETVQGAVPPPPPEAPQPPDPAGGPAPQVEEAAAGAQAEMTTGFEAAQGEIAQQAQVAPPQAATESTTQAVSDGGLAPEVQAAADQARAQALSDPSVASAPELNESEAQGTESQSLDPAEATARAQDLLAGFLAEADAKKASVLASTEMKKGEIRALVAERRAETQSVQTARIAELRSHFAGARAELEAQAAANRAELEAATAQDIGRARDEGTAQISDAENQLEQRRTEFAAFVQTERQQPALIAQSESARADAELEAAANEALAQAERAASRYPGSEDPAPEQREAAREVGRESAEDIRSKRGTIGEDLGGRADEFSEKYGEYTERIDGEIDAVLEQLLPAMRREVDATVTQLEEGRSTAAQALEQRLEVDRGALDAAETGLVAEAEAAGAATVVQLDALGEQALATAGEAGGIVVEQIDAVVAGMTASASVDEPNLPVIEQALESRRAELEQITAAGDEQLAAIAEGVASGLVELLVHLTEQFDVLDESGRGQTEGIKSESSAASTSALSERSNGATEAIGALTARLTGMLNETTGELDPAISSAREEVTGITSQFREEATKATDEALVEAKKPLTDETETRAEAAAEEVDEGWFSGLVRALGSILVGLVILVAVALLVAAIAGLMGIVLTAWTAIMIAGAILLVASLALSLYARFTQPELQDAPWYAKVGLALSDTVGVTGIIEGVTGKDIVTGEVLSDGEQTYRGVTGAFTFVMLALGARAAIKGPPGGVYTRPAGARGLPGAWRGVKGVATELFQAGKQQYNRLRNWLTGKGKEGKGTPAERLGIDESDLEPVGRGVFKQRGAKSPTANEIALAERLAAEAGDEIIVPRNANQAGIDGYFRRSGQPVQFKTLASSSASKVVTRANEAYSAARDSGWKNVDLRIEAPQLTKAQVLARWNAAHATPSVKPMPGGHVRSITVYCSDGVLSIPVPTGAVPVPARPVPAGGGSDETDETED